MLKSDKKALDGGRTGAPQWTPQPPPAASLRGRCGACSHVWVVAFLPMELDKVASLAARCACPKCSCTRVFVDSQPAGEVKHG